MNNDKEKKLWDDVYKEVIQLYPNKNINFITKQALIIFKKIKNQEPEKYKPTPIKTSSSSSKNKKKKNQSKHHPPLKIKRKKVIQKKRKLKKVIQKKRK